MQVLFGINFINPLKKSPICDIIELKKHKKPIFDRSKRGDTLEGLKKILDTEHISYEENVSAKRLTSFRTGGNVRLLITPKTRQELAKTFESLENLGIKKHVLGKGTNVLFSDDGYDGAIVSLSNFKRIAVCGKRITADAGATLHAVAVAAQKMSLSGFEFAHGIPGSVGGAVYMNAGAYGSDISAVLVGCECMNAESGEIVRLDAGELMLGYRYSILKDEKNLILLSAEFQLNGGDADEIYAKMEYLRLLRLEKQPLAYPSAGSTFKRPQGDFAGRLIEAAGLKGYTVGGAAVSEKHAGFVVNIGNATTADVLAVIEHVRATVYEKFGVALEPEIEFI